MTKNDQSTWKSTGTEGLYQNTHSGIFYSRYRLNGKRTFRSLKTTFSTRAKLLHAQRNVTIVKDRERGTDLKGNIVGQDMRTLGALLTELKRRFVETNSKPRTAEARLHGINRLKGNWQEGKFDLFLARNVTPEVIVALRQHLLEKAEWKRNRMKTPGKGYLPRVVNQTLWVLKVILDIAIEQGVIIDQPFNKTGTLRKTLRAKVPRINKREIPDRTTVLRIFAEMRRIPTEEEGSKAVSEHVRRLQVEAHEMADHAELLAYSGMRRGEARLSTLADDKGTEFKIWGYKTPASDRTIPVNSALRKVLDRIKERRVGATTKLVRFREPKHGLQRACNRLGLPNLHNHGLRHFFASVCIASGVDIPTISRWLGHGDGGTLAMQTYGHLLKDASQAAAAKVDFSDQSILKIG